MTAARNGGMPPRRVVAILTVRNPATVVVACVRLLVGRLYTGYGSNPVSRSPVGSLP